MKVLAVFSIVFIAYSSLVFAYIQGLPDDYCNCREKFCYILKGNTGTSLGGFEPAIRKSIRLAKADCEAAGLTPVVIDPAGFDDFRRAIQDPCAAEYVMFGHGDRGSVEASDGRTVDRWVIRAWLNQSFGALGGPVHPCAKKIIVHGCLTESDSWKTLFGVDDEHVFTWGIYTHPSFIWWWQLFHSQTPGELNLRAMPAGDNGCMVVTDPDEVEKTVEMTFQPHIKNLKDGITNIHASDGKQSLFLIAVSKQNGVLSDISYDESAEPDYVSTISSEYLFQLMENANKKPIGRQFEETCGNGQIDRGEQCDYGNPCPEGLECSGICICINPSWDDPRLPPRDDAIIDPNLAIKIDEPPGNLGFLKKLFYFIMGLFSFFGAEGAPDTDKDDRCDCTRFGQNLKGAEYCQNTFGPTTPNGYINYCQCHGEKCTCTYCDESLVSSSIYAEITAQKHASTSIDADESDGSKKECPGGYDDNNCYGTCQKNSKCIPDSEREGCFYCIAVCGAGEYYNDPSCGNLCTEGINECVASEDSNCYWCRPITGVPKITDEAKTALRLPSINMIVSKSCGGVVKFSGKLDEGDYETESVSVGVGKGGKGTTGLKTEFSNGIVSASGTFAEGDYHYEVFVTTKDNALIMAGKGNFYPDTAACTTETPKAESSCPYYDNSDCDGICKPSTRCDPEPGRSGCYFCNNVCGGGEYYNDPNCRGVCTPGVNICVKTSDVPCYACLSG